MAGSLAGLVVALILWLAALALFCRHWGSPGKRLIGLRVLRADGRPISSLRTWLREAAVSLATLTALFALFFTSALVCGIPEPKRILVVVGFGFPLTWAVSAAWCLWERQARCLWDLVAGTVVGQR